MILVCKNCKTSFLVPASLFKDGARRVKCTKCGETWIADKDGKSILKTTSSKEFIKKKAEELRKIAKEEAKNKEKTEEKEKQTTESLTTDTSQQKPNYLSTEEAQKLLLWSGLTLASCFLFLFLSVLFFHNQIVQIWPTAQYLFITVGLVDQPTKGSLFLQRIRSIRRYEEGAMRLIVSGRIYNQSDKTQICPEIMVNAFGPDKRLIKSWNIAPVQVTIGAGKTVDFSSTILSPKESVADVKLTFVKKFKEDDNE